MTKEDESQEIQTAATLEPAEIFDPPAVFAGGQAMQQIKTGYVTAVMVQKPRPPIAAIAAKVYEEAKYAGKSFYYAWPVKNKRTGKTDRVQGGSIDLAMCIARNYGNCAVDTEMAETRTHFIFKSTFIDLETGFTLPRLFRQRKDAAKEYGKMEEGRAEDIVFQLGQSKSQRNPIFRAMPKKLIDEAIRIAQESGLAEIKKEHPDIARAKAINFFSENGVTVERMIAKFGKKVEQWDEHVILTLREWGQAIIAEGVLAINFFKTDEEIAAEEKAAAAPAGGGKPLDRMVDAAKNGAAWGTGSGPEPPQSVLCPHDPDKPAMVSVEDCAKCKDREGCPAHEAPTAGEPAANGKKKKTGQAKLV